MVDDKAVDALDLPQCYFRDQYESLWEYSLEDGGLYFYGPFEEPAGSRVKAWLVQVEALTSALRMYELIGRGVYRNVFVDEYQID